MIGKRKSIQKKLEKYFFIEQSFYKFVEIFHLCLQLKHRKKKSY